MTTHPHPMPKTAPPPAQKTGGALRKAIATGAVALAVTAGVAACSTGSDYHGVCTDAHTHHRIDDKYCAGSHTDALLYYWMFFGPGSYAPPIGSPVSGGTRTVPSGSTATTGGVPTTGATISNSDDEDEDDTAGNTAGKTGSTGSNSGEDDEDTASNSGSGNSSVGGSDEDEDDEGGSGSVGGDDDDG
jgi:hypothetical protein